MLKSFSTLVFILIGIRIRYVVSYNQDGFHCCKIKIVKKKMN